MKAGRRNGKVRRLKARSGPSPSIRPASSIRGPAVTRAVRIPPMACGMNRTA
jgi:hypothetical protein